MGALGGSVNHNDGHHINGRFDIRSKVLETPTLTYFESIHGHDEPYLIRQEADGFSRLEFRWKFRSVQSKHCQG